MKSLKVLEFIYRKWTSLDIFERDVSKRPAVCMRVSHSCIIVSHATRLRKVRRSRARMTYLRRMMQVTAGEREG